MKKCVIYARYSSERQTEQSIEGQLRVCYEFAKNNDVEMSIYVDDVVFSSKNEIPQSFIDKLFGIIKGNDMQIKRQKVHNYKKESVKKVTGVFINGDKTRVANHKHYEFHIQYKYLKKHIVDIK